MGEVPATAQHQPHDTTTAYDVKTGTTALAPPGWRQPPTARSHQGNGQSTVTYLNAATEAIKTVAPGEASRPPPPTTAQATCSQPRRRWHHHRRLQQGRRTDVGQLLRYRHRLQPVPTNITYTYNADGQQTKMIDGTGTTTTGYNGFGLEQSTSNGAGKSRGLRLQRRRRSDDTGLHRLEDGAPHLQRDRPDDVDHRPGRQQDDIQLLALRVRDPPGRDRDDDDHPRR